MLAIEVAFLTGRYTATAYNTRTEGEWPPHPARLFSALAATHFAAEDAGVSDRAAERAILEWVERQGPPAIVASGAAAREIVTMFVPVNDVALTDVDDEARAADEAQAALAIAQQAGDAKVVKKQAPVARKAAAALERAIARATTIPAKPVNPRFGQRVLPEHRGRQPRTLPSVTPDEPRAIFVWTDTVPTAEQKASLDGLLRRVVRIGHSSSLVSVRLVQDPGTPSWWPTLEGESTLRVVEAGQVAALERAFERHREVEPRVMPSVPQSYTRRIETLAPPASPSIFSEEWLVLRRVGGPSLPMTATAGVARAVRRTLLSFAGEPIPEVLSGHTPDGRPSVQPHLAIIPLPFVGHQHASGAIVGVALVLPRAAGTVDRRAVYATVARWEQAHRTEDEDTPAVRLKLGAAGELFLERVEWGSLQASLRSQTWCRPATVWQSVTPVALDQNPGDLHSRDAVKSAAAIRDAVETILRSCERIDLPRPTFVEILPAAPLAGAAKSRHYSPYPAEASRTQRVLTHARIEFNRPVRGPILLGAGRFVGLGLFRPADSR